MRPIESRVSAGKLLAEVLRDREWQNAVVLALPRGGVPVAHEIARELALSMDVLFVKKMGAPGRPEYALGAISEDNDPVWNEDALMDVSLSQEDLKKIVDQSRTQVDEQVRKWRGSRKAIDLKGRTVLVVDDGLATGMTMKAAVELLRRRDVKRILVVAPVASRSAMELLKDDADEVIVLSIPEPFFSVGQWYEDFSQVTDEAVSQLLRRRTDFSVEEGVKPNLVTIALDEGWLEGELTVPRNPKGVVIFAHGSGSSFKSPRNQYVAQRLNQVGVATLLFDLLTDAESKDRGNVFNIPLLALRLKRATQWLRTDRNLKYLPIGYFGASTGAAAALVAANADKGISTVVSRGGRPDLAEEFLSRIDCPVLLIVGGADSGVIEPNESAKRTLKHAELVVVPGAGHLFEEPGALDQVVEYATDWFSNQFSGFVVPTTLVQPQEMIVQKIVQRAHPIQDSQSSLESLIQFIAKARLVMLGEATHGTEEFYRLRSRISKILIDEHGFKFVAVEGDWPDCYRLNQYLQRGDETPAETIMNQFKRWPTWMWANESVAEFLEWLKGRGAGFYGLDVYSLFDSIERVREYAKKVDPSLETRILESYSCFDFYGRNETEYARSIIKWPNGCEEKILGTLRDLLRLRVESTRLHDYELFDMQQNAKIIHNAERYYRAMVTGGVETWNIRDEHMTDTLDALLHHYGEGAKGIVWAHNTHIGDYHATDMVESGYINLGGLARERYGIENVALVGFGTYQGEVLAGRAWESKPEVMNLPKAEKGSFEDYFHKACEQMETDALFLRTSREKALSLRKGHRAVGVVYRPEQDTRGRQYVPTDLSGRYDAFVFVDTTTALKALPSGFEKGILPETWPSGV